MARDPGGHRDALAQAEDNVRRLLHGLGQCPGCGSWNSFAEEPKPPRSSRGGKPKPQTRRGASAVPITEAAAVPTTRTPTGLDGVDRVLGGGLVPGSLVLVAGEPGVG